MSKTLTISIAGYNVENTFVKRSIPCALEQL